MGIRITELPKMINPNSMVEDEIKKRYGSKCPFCGEEKSIWDFKNSKNLWIKG